MKILRALHLLVIAVTGGMAVYSTLGGYLMRPDGYSDVNMADGAWWAAAAGAFWCFVTVVVCAPRCTPARRWLLLACGAVWVLAVARMTYVDGHYAQFTPDG